LSYRLAKSLVTLREQINEAYPNRDKTSDGWIGDKAHRARKSDHNPNARGVVTALDVDKDLGGGMDAHRWAREVLVPTRDTRIEYVISNGQVWTHSLGWHKYTGSNPHEGHIHISVVDHPSLYDDERPWMVKQKPLKVLVKGKELKGAKIEDGVTLVPVRDLCKALGVEVRFDKEANAVVVGG